PLEFNPRRQRGKPDHRFFSRIIAPVKRQRGHQRTDHRQLITDEQAIVTPVLMAFAVSLHRKGTLPLQNPPLKHPFRNFTDDGISSVEFIRVESSKRDHSSKRIPRISSSTSTILRNVCA